MLLFVTPYRLYLMRFAEKKRLQALKSSSVKIKGNDVVASWKIMVGLPLAIVLFNVLHVVFYIFFSGRFVSGIFHRIILSSAFNFVFFWYIVMCIQMLNGIKTHFRVVTVRFFYVLYRNRIARVRSKRTELKKQVKNIMDKYSKLYEQSLYTRKSAVFSGDSSLTKSPPKKKTNTIKKLTTSVLGTPALRIEDEVLSDIFGSLVEIIGN